MGRPVKWRRILAEFAKGRKLTRFDAERLGDHVLPSTVQKIESKTGLRFEREFVALPGWCGTSVHVCRYWLSRDSKIRALEFLSGMAS